MPDIPKPADQYNLIQENWPPESESAYHAAALHWGQLSAAHDEAGNTTTSHAQQVASDFLGEAGGTYASQLQVDAAKFRANSASAASISTILENAAGGITTAKSGISGEVASASAAITLAKTQNRDKEAQSIIDAARSWVANVKQNHDQFMEKSGDYLEAGGSPTDKPVTPKPGETPSPGGERTDPKSGTTPGKSSGGENSGGSGGESSGGGGGESSGGGGGDTPGEAMPAAAASAPAEGGGMPEGGMPGGGMPSMPQMPQIPQQMPGQDMAGKGMDTLKDMIKPQGGQGQGDGTAIDNDTLNKLLDAQNSDSDPDTDSSSDSQGDDKDSGKDSGSGSGSSGVTGSTPMSPGHGGTSGPTPGVQGPSPASPVVSSATPGSSHAPHTQLSGAADGVMERPTTDGSRHFAVGAQPTPTAGGTGAGIPAGGMPVGGAGVPGGTRLSSAMGDASRTYGAASPRTSGSTDHSSRPGSWNDASALTPTTTVGAEVPGQQQQMPSFLDALPQVSREAHRLLATLSDQFLHAAWAAVPTAVGAFRKIPGGEVSFIYATADGVSVLPDGVSLPKGLIMLGRVDGIGPRFRETWAGVTRVADKLISLASDYPELVGELETVVVTESSPGSDDSPEIVEVQTRQQRKLIIDSGLGAPAVVGRPSLARLNSNAVPDALAQSDILFAEDFRTPEDSWQEEKLRRMAQLWVARRSTPSPDGKYTAAFAWYLLAEAHAAVTERRSGDAAFSLGELLLLDTVTA